MLQSPRETGLFVGADYIRRRALSTVFSVLQPRLSAERRVKVECLSSFALETPFQYACFIVALEMRILRRGAVILVSPSE